MGAQAEALPGRTDLFLFKVSIRNPVAYPYGFRRIHHMEILICFHSDLMDGVNNSLTYQRRVLRRITLLG